MVERLIEGVQLEWDYMLNFISISNILEVYSNEFKIFFKHPNQYMRMQVESII